MHRTLERVTPSISPSSSTSRYKTERSGPLARCNTRSSPRKQAGRHTPIHHGSHLVPHALPLPRPPPTALLPGREIPAHANPHHRTTTRSPAPPRQIRRRPSRTHLRRRRIPHRVRPAPSPAPTHPRRRRRRRGHAGLLRRRRRRQGQQQLRPRRGQRQRRERRRQREPERRHGGTLPAGAAAGAGQPAAAAQLRQVPARGGARPGGRRGVLRPRPARLPRRRRPAQPLRPRPLGGRPGQGPRRRLLPACRPGRARRLLCAGIVRELPVGRRGRRRRGSQHGRRLWRRLADPGRRPGIVGGGLLNCKLAAGQRLLRSTV